MPGAARSPITFIVPGVPVDAATRGRGPSGATVTAPLPRGKVVQSVNVGAARGAAGNVRVQATPGEDVVVLHIEHGPSLVLHPETARDLLLAQAENVRGRATTDAEHTTEIQVPVELRWRGLEDAVTSRGATRGFLGTVVLRAIEVVKDFVADFVKERAAELTAEGLAALVDGQVSPGVYQLGRGPLAKLKGKQAVPRMRAAGRPNLVLIHGTFVDTQSTYAKLWIDHPTLVQSLFDFYGDDGVFALDHPTLGQSPIENALTLADACPPGARLHLVTHSRGGLVAEVLARVCGSPTLTKDDRAFFAGPDHARQLQALEDLCAVVRDNDIRVERIVRVACPARGTLLASKRLDAYVSVFKWTLDLAGLPVAGEIVDFLGAVAQLRTEAAILPGLEAQVPDSPLIQWLHAAPDRIPGELRVVAGDIEGDSVKSWIKTLLADAFYWTDNDLVVQTRSMYGGAPRRATATFVLDRGGTVSHFAYFANATTAEAITRGLTQDTPQGYRLIGPLSWAGTSATGYRAGLRAASDGKPLSDKPAVILLPGILGSNLKIGDKRIWLGWRTVNGLQQLAYAPGDGIEPDGPIDLVYDALVHFLSKTHEVIEFAFDWRVPMEDEANRLAGVVDAALTARQQSGTPVRFLAHSMGGLVARTMQIVKPAVWDRMMAVPGARLLMLGTPNDGSWAPMQVLSGDDTFGNALVLFGAPFQGHEARRVMAELPGFMQLQAALFDEGERPLGKRETWLELAKRDLDIVKSNSVWHKLRIQLQPYEWGIPKQSVLDAGVKLRKALDAQRDNVLPRFADKLVVVTGKAKFTPAGYAFGDKGLDYLDDPDTGDGRVTWQSAQLPGVETWAADAEHAKLPLEVSAFDAYLELLETGKTTKSSAAARRGAAMPTAAVTPRVRSRPSRGRGATRPPENPTDVLAVAGRDEPGPRPSVDASLEVRVDNGDLKFVREPLLLGHYVSQRLTGSEAAMNSLTGGTMYASLSMRQYPDQAGTHQVFVNAKVDPDDPARPPRPEAVIVVGLGAEGKLRSSELIRTVRLGAIAWAQRMIERPGHTSMRFDLAATLIGSGGTGVSAGLAAQLIAQGVWEANEHLAKFRWPRIGRLILIELYLDRAAEAWRALRLQQESMPERFVVDGSVHIRDGALRRPLDSGYRGADYDFVSAISGDDGSRDAIISYTLDTKRARSEVRARSTQGKLVRELVRRASNGGSSDVKIGSALFRLLVPVEIEPFFAGATELVMELDGGTAAIPWELLDDGSRDDAQPWAIRAKLLRKLRTENYRPAVKDSSNDDDVLIIGEPQCDPIYPRLRGARAEALAIKELFELPAPAGIGPERVHALVSQDPEKQGADALEVIGTILDARRDWRIIHIAGHGEPPEWSPVDCEDADVPKPRVGNPRGVVLSCGTFLGPREIDGMRKVPELVFINCCHLAARDVQQTLKESKLGRPYDRSLFAATVAEELIRIGVRCVIAAGWAVADNAAEAFAKEFYGALLRGERFIDAVAHARREAKTYGGDTWGAYQCYGDPDWVFVREGGDAQRPPKPFNEEFGGVASPDGLKLALETIAAEIHAGVNGADPDGSDAGDKVARRADRRAKHLEQQRGKIRYLEARHASKWRDIGLVAEAFGLAWEAAGDRSKAVDWYERAVESNDGSASLKALERFSNVRARLAYDRAKLAGTAGSSADRAASRDRDPASLLADEITIIATALDRLDQLTRAHRTRERLSLCGSACKRLALVEAMAGHQDKEHEAIARMRDYYQGAERLALEVGDDELFYPALNRMAAAIVVDGATAQWRGFDPSETQPVRESLARKAANDPDFWSLVGAIELDLYVALGAREIAKHVDAIIGRYADLHSRDGSTRWRSVLDQLEFVLPRYAASAAPPEKEAAGKLLEAVRSFVN
jgi:tetratricopeptide (TPR) repeat protein